MKEMTVYHNPRWKKSREAVQLLRENGVEPELVEYLKTPLDTAALKNLAQLMSLRPKDFIRKGEAVFKELQLSDKLKDDNALFRAMAENPKLIERPIIVRNNNAVLGRPPERVLELLGWASTSKARSHREMINKERNE